MSAEGNMITILDLPENVLEFICKLLVDSSKPKEDFRSYLYDLMALRSSCAYLNSFIIDMVLDLDCEITPDWFVSSGNQNLLAFVDFIKRNTNWRIKCLRIEDSFLLEDYDVLSLLQQNEDLFRKCVKQVLITVPKFNRTPFEKVFDWLRRIALTNDPSVSLLISNSCVSLLNPELVSELNFYECEDDYPTEVAFQSVSLCPNLTKLHLPFVQFSVEQVKAFPSLKVLTVGGLSTSVNQSSLSASKVEILVVNFPDDTDVKSLPDIIKVCFPRLIDFTFLMEHIEVDFSILMEDMQVDFSSLMEDIEVDFSSLPISCKFLTTEIEHIRYFIKCVYVKKISVSFRRFEKLSVFERLSSLSLETVQLKMGGGVYGFSAGQLLTVIARLLEKFKSSLRILSVDYNHSTDAKNQYKERRNCELFDIFDSSLRDEKKFTQVYVYFNQRLGNFSALLTSSQLFSEKLPS